MHLTATIEINGEVHQISKIQMNRAGQITLVETMQQRVFGPWFCIQGEELEMCPINIAVLVPHVVTKSLSED